MPATCSVRQSSNTVPFAMVPCWLFREGYAIKVGAYAFTVYTCMIHHAYGENRRCYCSIRRLAQETGLAERTVGRALRVLRHERLIIYCDQARPGYRGRGYEVPLNPPHLPNHDSDTTPRGHGNESHLSETTAKDDADTTRGRTTCHATLTEIPRGGAPDAYKLVPFPVSEFRVFINV